MSSPANAASRSGGKVFGRPDGMRSFIVACFLAVAPAALAADDLIPLNELGPAPYRLGYYGGLYDHGTNVMPAEHFAAGMSFAERVRPLDANGQPSPSGKIGFIAVGMGDTARVICSLYRSLACEPGSFASMVKTSSRVNPDVVVVNAAYEDFDALITANNGTALFERIHSSLLLPAGITDMQVQVAWLQISSSHPFVSIIRQFGDAYWVKGATGNILRALKAQYPNLQIAYLSSRPFGGYSADSWNSEPFAYETGLSARWVIVEQIDQVRTGVVTSDTRTGDVSYVRGRAPWIAWGPYMWANGTQPRSDGLTWQPDDYDGQFLSEKGAHKAAGLLFNFLMKEPTARGWFAVPKWNAGLRPAGSPASRRR